MEKVKLGNVSGKALVSTKGGKTRILIEGKEPIIVATPSWLPQGLKDEELRIRLNKENELISATPWDATVTCKFYKFFAREGAVPAPEPKEATLVPGRGGERYPIDAHLEFSPISKIVSPPEFAGMTVSGYLWYMFGEKKGKAILKGSGGKQYNLLDGFMDATGLSEADIAYSDNILPACQRAMLMDGRTYRVKIENGYAKEYIPLKQQTPADEDEDWAADVDEDKPAPKPVADDSSWGDAEEDDDTVSDEADADEIDKLPF